MSSGTPLSSDTTRTTHGRVGGIAMNTEATCSACSTVVCPECAKSFQSVKVHIPLTETCMECLLKISDETKNYRMEIVVTSIPGVMSNIIDQINFILKNNPVKGLISRCEEVSVITKNGSPEEDAMYGGGENE